MWRAKRSRFAAAFLFVAGLCLPAAAQQAIPPCTQCEAWNVSQQPFRVYGNTYYVGTHGLSSVLITSKSGHVLIDADLEQSVPKIVANIRALGFRVEDIKLILNSHVHFDHAGGIAEMQRLSGARVAASDWSAEVMTRSGIAKDDPQFGAIAPIPLIRHVQRIRDGETLHVSDVALTAHSTPGHTPGGTSWTWRSCENGRCLNMVFADSLTPVSNEKFRFTSPENSQLLKGFDKSFAFLETVPCDILVTTHPDISDLWTRLDRRNQGVSPDPMIDQGACKNLANRAREQLRKRIADESGH